MADKYDIGAFLRNGEEWKDVYNYGDCEIVYTYWTLLIAEKRINGDLVFKFRFPKIPRSREEAIEIMKRLDEGENVSNNVHLAVKHEIDRWGSEWVTYYERVLDSGLREVLLVEEEEEKDAYFEGEYGYIHNRSLSYHETLFRYWTIEECEEENGILMWRCTESSAFKNTKKELLQAIKYPTQYESSGLTIWIYACHRIVRSGHEKVTFYKLSFDGKKIIKEKVKVNNYKVKPDYTKKKPQA